MNIITIEFLFTIYIIEKLLYNIKIKKWLYCVMYNNEVLLFCVIL